MSSPFRYFRKHSKAFMAVAAVLCMFIFVVGGAFSGGGSGNDGPQVNATVATWNGGSLDQGQLNALMQQRLITDEFLKRLFAAGGGQDDYDLPADIPWRGVLLTGQDRENLEQVVIQTEIQAELAKEAGITVSDDLISHYIQKMGLNKVSGEQVEELLKSVGNGNPRTSEGIVFGTLRKVLAAHFYTRLFSDAGLVVLPHQRWNDWRQVNERVSLQAAILPVDKFLAEVPQPTEDQLKALYEDFKEFDPGRRVDVGGRLLQSPDPGFAEPQRVRLQYLKGSVADLAERLMDKVSDQDVAYYYEQHKDSDFRKIDAPLTTPPADSAPATPTAESAAEAAPATPPTEEAAPAAEAEPATTPATEATPAATPESETPAAETPATESPATENSETEAAPEASAEGDESSDIRRSSPFQLVSFQEETAESEAPAETSEASSTPAETNETAEPATAEAAEAPAAETPAATEPAAEEPSVPVANETPAAPASGDLYEPLENVRDEIRRLLAQEMASEELTRILSESMAQLQTEFNAYGIATIEAEEAGKPAPKAPAKLADLQWLADKHGLVYEKTSPLTFLELYDTPVGKAVGASTQQMTVAQAAFYALKPYEPFLANELEGDGYIVMKTEDIARRIPEFKEVREQVVTAWKQREAAKLADKKAQELAAEFQKSNVPFDQFFFADRAFEVVNETALFSWLNYPTGRPGYGSLPSLSDVPELKSVGPQFMEKAFALGDNEAAGILNYDQTAAYVIRIARKQWSDDELKKLFLEEAEAWPGRYDMLMKHASIFNNALESEVIENRTGLKFDEKWLEERQKRIQGKR